MAFLSLNCPRCRKQIVHVPLDGLVLYYECPEHGALVLHPLDVVESDEARDASVRQTDVTAFVRRSLRHTR